MNAQRIGHGAGSTPGTRQGRQSRAENCGGCQRFHRAKRDAFGRGSANQTALRLATLQNEFLGKNILAHPEYTHLFLIESEGKKFGAEDWQVSGVKACDFPDQSFSATRAAVGEVGSGFFDWRGRRAVAFRFESDERFGANAILENSVSANRWFAIIVAEVGDLLFVGRRNCQCQFQPENFLRRRKRVVAMVDVFSPEGGAVMMLRSLDETGLWKGVAMRKG